MVGDIHNVSGEMVLRLKREAWKLTENGTWVAIEDPPPPDVLPETIRLTYLWVIMAIGLPGNMAALFTMATVSPATTATFLMSLLAVSDTAAIVVKLVFNQTKIFTGALCRAFHLPNLCSSYANWVLVLIAFERLVAVTRPMSRASCLSKRKMAVVCCFLFLAILSFQLPFMVHNKYGVHRHRYYNKDFVGCYTPDHLAEYSRGAWAWINRSLHFFLPVVLLFLLTTGLCLALRKARRRRKALLAGSAGVSSVAQGLRRATRAERALTLMMMSASVLLMVLLLPQCLFYILVDSTDLLPHVGWRKELWRQVVFVMADATHALNFYLYFASVAAFRRRFVALITCRKRPCDRDDRFSRGTIVTTSLSH